MPSHPSATTRTLVAIACLAAALSITGAVSLHDGSPSTDAGGRVETITCGSGRGEIPASVAKSGDLSLDTFAAPGEEYDRLTNATAVSTARRTGSLTPASVGIDRAWADEVIAYRDTVVHRVRLSGSAVGLLDRLTARDRRSPTAAFRALVARGDLGFDYIGATACPPTLALNASIDRGAIRAVPDRANDTLYLVFDTDRLLFYPPGGDDPTADTFVRGHHTVSLTLRVSSGLVPRNVTVKNDYRIEDAGVAFVARHEGLIRVTPAADRFVRGRTTLAPGSEVTVSLHPIAANGGVVNATAVVNRSRAFSIRFGLSNASPSALYALAVPGVTEPPAVEGGATLVAAGNATGALIAVSNHTSDGTTLFTTSLTTTDGGFVTVRNASGGLVGVSGYVRPGATVVQPDLSPPLAGNQTVTVTVYRDANGNRAFDDADVPYRVNGSVASDDAAVRLERDREATATSSPPDTTMVTTTTPPPTSTTNTTTTPPPTAPTTTTPGLPGFGLPTAAVAVFAAGSLAVRRLA